MNTQQKMIEDNMNLVKYIFNKKFSKNREMEEDILQEGYIGLTIAAKTFDQDTGIMFSTYAYKVIYNQILMFLRGNKNKDMVSLDEEVVEDGSTLVDMLVADTEEPALYTDLHKAIKSLKPKLRDTILDIYFDGKYYREVAEGLGMTKQNVSKRHQQALKQLKEKLGDKYEDYN